ncbi:MAG TPA: N-acetyl-gamma-glutamyl-phosphate reductase [Symbiobacteriaceae bacterium]|nr:N-acetyl-gamma-glutamyl-phosphate reductase [Symbiobacteriaceae bacterium]
MQKIRAAIIGSTGYGGVELIRLLLNHPQVEIAAVLSSSSAGDPLTASYPHLQGIYTGQLEAIDPQTLKAKVDVVFAATPTGISAQLVPQLLEAGLTVIDLSGDFRLKDPNSYATWYKHTPAAQALLDEAVYGMPELKEGEHRKSRLISNPGCYCTAAILGLAPALAAGWIDPATIIIDAKSGVSGAGRGASLGTHYSELNENFKAYKVNQHQHIPEIEQALGWVAGKPVPVTFTTHLVPMTRGIMCTSYATQVEMHTAAEWVALYARYYEGRPFVRVRPAGALPSTKEVWGSNYCDIGLAPDARTGRLTVVSVIDNLVKGAAGQAIQNLNLLMGWAEDLGLRLAPVYP